jgi:hypothetical protein
MIVANWERRKKETLESIEAGEKFLDGQIRREELVISIAEERLKEAESVYEADRTSGAKELVVCLRH